MYKSRWKQRLEDFESALTRLGEALDKKKIDDLEKDGVIQRFEFTFELAWKTIKDYLEEQGFNEATSPKKVLKLAYQEKLFKDAELWLEMLNDRNSVAHLYQQQMSDEVFKRIRDKYLAELKRLLKYLKKEL